MANKSVFTGADGAITLSASQGPEGDNANATISQYEFSNSVGRVQNVTVEISNDVRAFFEIGSRYPTELRPGNISISGTIGRAYLNGAMLKLLLGDGVQQSSGNFLQPSFNIILSVDNPAATGDKSTITLYDVKLNNWNYSLPEDDFVVEQVAFQARYIAVKDES